jgi:hypothetical protein
MMKKEINKEYSLLVFMKAQHKYTDSEVQLETLCKEKYSGRCVGGGTNLSNGKRDQQFVFNNLANAKAFLNHPFTKAVTLKEYDLVETGSDYNKKVTLNTVRQLGKVIRRNKKNNLRA